jgi:serine/threonine-protein kinase
VGTGGGHDPRPRIVARAAEARAGAASDFESEFSVLLHRRLRTTIALLWALALSLYALNAIVWILQRGWDLGFLRQEQRLLAGCLVGAAFWLVLRRERLRRRTLDGVDALQLWTGFAVVVADYAILYEDGGERGVEYVALLMVVRAVMVPSRALRTALVSAVGPLAILGVQVVRGRAGYPVPANAPDWAARPPFGPEWRIAVFWDQVFMAIGLVVATIASRVNFSLRVRVHAARTLDRYVLDEPLGKGSMGEVYRAHHALLRRPVAIKLLRAEIAGEATIRRFEREVQETSRLTHPNTVGIYDYGATGEGTFYYAMELLDGADLDRVVRVGGPLPAGRVIRVLTQVCRSLGEAHENGLVHRDVKPQNVVLCRRGLEDDVVKVMDFGLVRDTRAPASSGFGEIVGTPETMAPEVIRGDPATPRSDLYGVGAIGVFLLTGSPVFPESRLRDLLTAHLEREPERPSARVPSVPPDLEGVLLSCLEKDPERRPASAAALERALLGCADAAGWTGVEAASWWGTHGAALRAAVASPDGPGPGPDGGPAAS